MKKVRFGEVDPPKLNRYHHNHHKQPVAEQRPFQYFSIRFFPEPLSSMRHHISFVFQYNTILIFSDFPNISVAKQTSLIHGKHLNRGNMSSYIKKNMSLFVNAHLETTPSWIRNATFSSLFHNSIERQRTLTQKKKPKKAFTVSIVALLFIYTHPPSVGKAPDGPRSLANKESSAMGVCLLKSRVKAMHEEALCMSAHQPLLRCPSGSLAL